MLTSRSNVPRIPDPIYDFMKLMKVRAVLCFGVSFEWKGLEIYLVILRRGGVHRRSMSINGTGFAGGNIRTAGNDTRLDALRKL